jgi:hypothetical protein
MTTQMATVISDDNPQMTTPNDNHQMTTIISDDNPPMTTQMTTPDDNSHFR